MTATAVIGMQWGDEAKGKLVDMLAEQADFIVRFNGGDNAGHTVVNPLGTFKLRLMPSGIFNEKAVSVIGPGVVVNLATLIDEIATIERSGLTLANRLWVSPRCSVVMPYHPLIEKIFETAKGTARTGTTGRGMGPVYADKVSYNAIRLFDLAQPDVLAEKLRVQLAIKNPMLQAFGMPALDLDTLLAEKLAQYARVQEYLCEPFGLLQAALEKNQAVLLEGAQGALLDNDWGTYPFCTASTTLAGGSAAGAGIAAHWLNRVVGVAKAYTTRVGAGPLPTELLDETGEALRQAGQEFGTVTGRPRRCGWFDAELVGFTARLNGASELALTKLDVLDGLPRVKIGVGYRAPGETGSLRHYWEGDAAWLERCRPEYIELPGWQESTTAVRRFDDLPAAAQAYVRKIAELTATPVSLVSVGPGRDETFSVPD